MPAISDCPSAFSTWLLSYTTVGNPQNEASVHPPLTEIREDGELRRKVTFRETLRLSNCGNAEFQRGQWNDDSGYGDCL